MHFIIGKVAVVQTPAQSVHFYIFAGPYNLYELRTRIQNIHIWGNEENVVCKIPDDFLISIGPRRL